MFYLPPYLPESPLPRPSQAYLPLLSVQAHVNFRHEGGRERERGKVEEEEGMGAREMKEAVVPRITGF